VGYSRFRAALLYLAVVVCWSLTVRFEYPFLVAHPGLLRLMAVLTVGMAAHAVFNSGALPHCARPIKTSKRIKRAQSPSDSGIGGFAGCGKTRSGEGTGFSPYIILQNELGFSPEAGFSRFRGRIKSFSAACSSTCWH